MTSTVLQQLHATHGIENFPSRVSEHFSSLYMASEEFLKIPPLDVDHPPESYEARSLVRFRCMIQDTSLASEMYLATLPDTSCGGWGFAMNTSDSDDLFDASAQVDKLRECAVMWAVTVPGETAWVRTGLSHSNTNPSTRLLHKPTQPHKYVNVQPHVGVQVKIYEHAEAEKLKSTDIVTFVGILTSETWQTPLESGSPAVVPTLHVLYHKTHSPTILPRIYPYDPSTIALESLREELITWIADEAVAGDRDAAEWILLSSIARVQSRSPPILPPSMLLTKFPGPSSTAPSRTPVLTSVLENLFPTVLTIPLSLKTLNDTSFAPESKDEDLHSGWLQIPQGSLCVVTETDIEEGQVNQKGLMNLRSLQEMMTSQTLQYVFPFSEFSFPTDVSFLIICDGRKSAFFQTTVTVPLVPRADASTLYKLSSDISVPSPEKLAMFRHLVGGAKIGTISVGEEVAEHIQHDFVTERKASAASSQTAPPMTADDLIHQMRTAKLLSLSLHRESVTKEIWEDMKKLEQRRQARLV